MNSLSSKGKTAKIYQWVYLTEANAVFKGIKYEHFGEGALYKLKEF